MRPVYLVRSVVVCLALAVPAIAAAGVVRHAVPADAIRVTADSGTTKVSVHLPGMLDRVIWLRDQIYSIALADLNNDGHLDLVASTKRHVLVVWRSTPLGFVRQHHPGPPRRVRYDRGLAPASGGVAATQATDDHRDPIDLMPGMGLIAALLPSEPLQASGEHLVATPLPLNFGRAPPETV